MVYAELSELVVGVGNCLFFGGNSSKERDREEKEGNEESSTQCTVKIILKISSKFGD